MAGDHRIKSPQEAIEARAAGDQRLQLAAEAGAEIGDARAFAIDRLNTELSERGAHEGAFPCAALTLSDRLERGEVPRLGDAVLAWRRKLDTLAVFSVVLLVLEMLWGRAAMIVFAISFDGVPDFTQPLAYYLTEEYITFAVVYSLVGGVFAGLIYAISVISMPLLLDRQVDAVSAGLLSMRLVLTQTGVMLWWAALIAGLTLLAMLPGFLGLLLAGPVLGHASWHAYRGSVRCSD